MCFSVSIRLANENIHVCVSSDNYQHYLVMIYPPVNHLHVCLLEQQTTHLIRLIEFLFGSLQQAFTHSSESIDYFFRIFFYRFSHLTHTSSKILEHVRLVDEYLPAQFNDYGTCPKLFVHDAHVMSNVDACLNQLECQVINECSNEHDTINNRYRRQYFLSSHLSNELTIDIYRFLVHYGHITMSQLSDDSWQLLLFKEIFPCQIETKQRSYLLVCSEKELTLAVIMENQYQTNTIEYTFEKENKQISLSMVFVNYLEFFFRF
jgi:hypothetical protein